MLIQNLFLTFAITRTRQASQRCSNERVVFFNMARPFNKHYSSPHDLVDLLISRRLTISDKLKAEKYLKNIGYYRLSAYMYPLLEAPKNLHQFKPGSSFSQVLCIYRFDKKLRLLMFNEIEKIEIAVRSTIVDIASSSIPDPFWMTDAGNYSNPIKYQNMMAIIDTELRRSREDFIQHFYLTYSESYPPAWMLAEILPFGVITGIYANLKNKSIKKRISQYFDLQIKPFESWLTIITLTRNACCHHARVWNKRNTIRAMIPNTMLRPWITLPTDSLRIYFNLCIIKYFVDVISQNNHMKKNLLDLLAQFPNIDIQAMGFPSNWEQEPIWQN